MKMKSKSIKVLHLEDLPTDAELVARVLNRSTTDFEIRVADTRIEFENALQEFIPEIIISDHSLPSFNSLEAMDILKKAGFNIPFILVTGAVSDEFAAIAMKKGADDYVLKDRLQRLPAAMLGALEKFRLESEQLEIERKIKESEKQYFDLIQHLPAAIYTVDVNGRILLYNKAAVELWGREPQIGNDLWSGPSKTYDFEGRTISPSKSPMFRAMKEERKLYDEEIIIERPDGTRRHVVQHPSPNFNSSGKLTGGTNMLIDITDRKKAELETLTLVDILKFRNKELGQFAYMVSHHLRAPIARILGLASIFDTDPSENKFIVEKITDATLELDTVVKDINNVVSARNLEKEKKEFVKFETKVNLITKVLEREIKESGALITTDFSQASTMVTVKSYLYSIFHNLVSNAIKFRQPEVPLHIHLRTTLNENFVCLSVKDNGMGIDMKKNAKHVFGIYKRFHGDSISGKGVGLHLIKTQVESLGGRVELESKVNEGAEFKIYLPNS
jgi:PAS domain S-box-containing protein